METDVTSMNEQGSLRNDDDPGEDNPTFECLELRGNDAYRTDLLNNPVNLYFLSTRWKGNRNLNLHG